MPDVGKIIKTSDAFEWGINNFLNLSEEDGYYSSLFFYYNGVRWYFWIFPNGDGGNGYVELRLFKWEGNSMRIKFSFALKTVNGEKHMERQCTGNFRKGFEERTYPHIISRPELVRKKTELLPLGVLTVVFSLEIQESANEDEIYTVSCSYCKKIFDAEKLSCHEKKCRVKCPECSDVIPLQNWNEHECQISRAEECSYCKKNVNVENISIHEKKCMDRSIRCPECSEVVLLQKWYDHQCQAPRAKECSYCKKNVNVENISMHEKKCMDRPIRCPECSEVVLLQKWYDHKCQAPGVEDEIPLCEDLKEMLLNGMNHDLILKVGDKELKAHQDVLRTRSQVFKSMLSHDTKEKNSGVVDIPDCDPQAMEQFLFYIYTGKVDSLEESVMLKLYYIADKYDMKGLKRKCCAFIKKSLSYTNICAVIQLALNHSDSNLLEHATEYFKDNTLDIMCTVEWQTFLKENSTVANELMMKSFQKLKDAST